MSYKKFWRYIGVLVILVMLLPGCKAATPETPATAQPTAEVPTQLDFAFIVNAPFDEPWSAGWLEAFERVKAQKPHGLTLTLDTQENVWAGPDAERVLRTYAETGKYEIIYGHDGFSDEVKELMDEYPEILWGFVGSGNEGLGGNAFWTYMYLHEASYLEGLLAGLMTETNVLGVVAGFPSGELNADINGFIAGARASNPDVKVKVTFIESWYDPAKAQEAAYAQIAAGADFIMAVQFGPIEAVKEKGILAFGHRMDQHHLGPGVVITSAVDRCDQNILYYIDQWWSHVTTGEPYNAPLEPVWYSMAEGGSELAPFYELEESIPTDVMEAVMKVKEDILSGVLVVPLNTEIPVSD